MTAHAPRKRSIIHFFKRFFELGIYLLQQLDYFIKVGCTFVAQLSHENEVRSIFAFVPWDNTSKSLVATTGGGESTCQGMGKIISECVNVIQYFVTYKTSIGQAIDDRFSKTAVTVTDWVVLDDFTF